MDWYEDAQTKEDAKFKYERKSKVQVTYNYEAFRYFLFFYWEVLITRN